MTMQPRLGVCDEWTFEDEGFSGASLVRPGLAALRDSVAQVPVEVVVCYAPDHLARCARDGPRARATGVASTVMVPFSPGLTAG